MTDIKATSALILGVSECPSAPTLQSLQQCATSAFDFDAYLRGRLKIASPNILNLFDSDDVASQQLEKIDEWLMHAVKGGRADDLIVYYTGHGAFAGSDQSYILIVRRTKAGLEGATSIRYSDLALCLKQRAPRARRYLILDCCFAASAVPKHQSSLNQALVRKVEDELPPSGTAVLCSSSAKLVSIAPIGKRHTMFSGALLASLNDGVPNGPEVLSLEDIGNRARDLIKEEFTIDAVRPELHVPEQQKGNPARVPLFPNPLWTGEQQDSKAAAIKPWWRHRPKPGLLGFVSGISAAFCSAYLGNPWGVPSFESVSMYPPMGPAVALIVAMLFAAIPSLSLRVVLAISVSVTLAWVAAWNVVWWGVLALMNWPGFQVETALPICVGPAGFIGAVILTFGIDFIGHKRNLSLKQIGICVVSCLIPFGVLPGAGYFCGYLADELPLSLWSVLGLYVPWHVQMLIRSQVGPAGELTYLQGLLFLPKHFAAIFTSSVVLSICIVTFGPTTAIHVRRALSNQPIIYSVRVATYANTSKEDKSLISIRYDVGKVSPEPIECALQLKNRTNGASFDIGSMSRFVQKFSNDFAVFEVPTDAIPTLSVRQVCPEAKFESDWEELKAQPDLQSSSPDKP